MSLAAKSKGFNYPKSLDDWLSPQWKYFDIRKYPQTPWLKPAHIRKIKNFERTLNSKYPTLTDTKIRGWRPAKGSWSYRQRNRATLLRRNNSLAFKYLITDLLLK